MILKRVLEKRCDYVRCVELCQTFASTAEDMWMK